jgi:hypothetical protein
MLDVPMKLRSDEYLDGYRRLCGLFYDAFSGSYNGVSNDTMFNL